MTELVMKQIAEEMSRANMNTVILALMNLQILREQVDGGSASFRVVCMEYKTHLPHVAVLENHRHHQQFISGSLGCFVSRQGGNASGGRGGGGGGGGRGGSRDGGGSRGRNGF